MSNLAIRVDPRLDLVLQRVVDVPRELVWKAWTTPEHVKHWFTPRPWTTVACEIDLRPGGVFRTVMRSPDGRDTSNIGCYLEIVPEERLVWTTALKPGYRPMLQDGYRSEPVDRGLLFTAVITLEPSGSGTQYTATAIHPDEPSRVRHEAMGFHRGWNTALDQLVAFVKTDGGR